MRDKIWLTARTRMIAESRLRQSNKLWSILIVWYSTLLTCLTVYLLVSTEDKKSDLIAALLAIVILSLSIYIPTLSLRTRADSFRACYLKLQKILDTEKSEPELASQYHEILGDYPNHEDEHWIALIVRHHRRGEPLTSNDETINVDWKIQLSYYFDRFLYCSGWVLAFAAPVAVYFIIR